MATGQNPNYGGKAEEDSLKIPSKDPKKKKDQKEYELLSEEDLALKHQLELCVEKVQDSDTEVQNFAVESMRREIRTSISSNYFLPKPIKFLRQHYGRLKVYYKKMGDSDVKKCLADVLSVLAMTMSAEGKRESLKYRLLGSEGDIDSWGHEYVRNLAVEILQECAIRWENCVRTDDLSDLVLLIVDFHMKHNAGPEAIDLIMEISADLNMLTEHIDATNYRRTLSYLTSFVSYFHKSDTLTALEISHQEYLHFEEFPNALRIALFLDESKYVYQVFKSCNDLLQKEQLCFILAQHGIDFLLDEEIVAEDDDRGALQDIIYNAKLSEGYLYLARDIEVMEPKYPEDVYKVDSIHHWAAGLFVDSNMQNLAATYVNAFVNAGFGQDTLMTVPSENLDCGSTGSWVFKNKDHGKASAAASLGMIFLWNFDSGRAQINKYIHSNDNYVVAGALLGSGIVNCNVTNDNDTVLSLLADYVHNEDSSVRIGAIMGLGLAYAGSQNELIQEKLSSVLKDRRAPIDVIAFTAISLGLVFVGSCNIPVADSIISSIACLSDEELGQPMSHLPPVGLGLIYLGKKDRVKEVTGSFKEYIRQYCDITLLSCAYAGSGDVLQVQISLDDCTPHSEDAHQCPAVLGIAMVAMAEEVGLEMAIRSLEHLLQYGEHNIRQTVPLALGLLCISNPKIKVIDTLSKLSHDKDSEVLMRAIISLGLIGAGTNNARIARILRKLLRLYYKEPQFVFCVQIAQGLLEMGKGLLTLNPYHSERFLLSKTALAGIITFLHACLDNMACILGKYHYIIYFLVLAIKPRMLITVDEKLKPLAVPVRVGQAVDVVGMPGRPKTITGFQTHLTPVILGAGKRAELATEEYIPLTPILEGFVILKKNPEYGD